jgi:tetratricopeptide (TPR) repeat protein
MEAWGMSTGDRFSWLAWGVGISVALVQPGVLAKSATEVNDIAQAIAVKISTTNGNGSGILLQKQGDVYTLLTAAHVVKNGRASYTITTPDGRTYQPIANSIRRYQGDVDLAVLKFRSSATYKLAELGDSNVLQGGMDIYVAGFPAPTAVISESTFFFREGKVTANSKRAYKNGYGLVYSNDTLPGMSGGPVLNANGEVVGVHGKGDREINTSTGDPDGPKTGFNTAIPIARFADIAQSLGITLITPVAQTIPSPTLTADDYFLAAYQKSEKNDFRGALADYNQAISLNPKYLAAYNNRGLLKAKKINDPPGALADYNLAISLYPKFVEAYNNRGNLKKDKLNDPQGALADYNLAISLDPKFAPAYNNRGNLKKDKLNDPQGALADYNLAISLNPRDSVAYNNRGNLKDDLNDTQGALVDYNQAISLNSQYVEAYYNRGLLKMLKLNDPQGALTDYNLAISLNSKYDKAYINRGVLKATKLNDPQGALADYNLAISLDPKFAPAYNNRGNLKKDKLNDPQGALTDFNQAISLNPKYANAYYNRGLLKKNKLNDRTGAVADFRAAAQLYRQQGKTSDLQDAIDRLRALGASE